MTILKNNKEISKRASLDQLDIPIEIRISKSWIVWIVVISCLFAVLLWSIFGAVNVCVDGPGIIVPKSVAMFNATSEGSGLLLTVNCKLGDVVKKGQIIATVDVTELKQKIDHAEKFISKLKEEDRRIYSYANTQTANLKTYSNKLDLALDEKKSNSEKYKAFLVDFVGKEEHLKTIGAISSLTYENSLESLYEVNNELFQIMSERASNALKLEESYFKWTQHSYNIKIEIMKYENDLESQKIYMSKRASVRSPIDGVVNQIYLLPGSYAKPGNTVATIASQNKKKEAFVFLPTNVGKRVQRNMTAFVSPTITKKERYGAIIGTVLSISEYPLDSSMLSSLLKDHDLAKLFSAKGPPIMCRLDLCADPKNITGFAWTSGKGPPFKITDGNICDISVVVERRVPITFVLPFMRKWLGLEYE